MSRKNGRKNPVKIAGKAAAKAAGRKTAVKVAGKAGSKAVPGVGQVLMALEAAPVAVGAGHEWSQSLGSTYRETRDQLRERRYGKAAKAVVQGTIDSNLTTLRGGARTALAAITAREVADATVPERHSVREAVKLAEAASKANPEALFPSDEQVQRYFDKNVLEIEQVEDLGLFRRNARRTEMFDQVGLSHHNAGVLVRAFKVEAYAGTLFYVLWRHPKLKSAQGRRISPIIIDLYFARVPPAEELVLKTRSNPRRARRNPGAVGPYQDLLAALRALQWLSWSKHWTASGPSFYGDHLLLQRIYSGEGGPDINEQIDQLGEKMVAYFGPASVDPRVIEAGTKAMIDTIVKQQAGPFEALLVLEEHVQKLTRLAYQQNQASGADFSLGFDDYLMGLANDREIAVYLLRRRLA